MPESQLAATFYAFTADAWSTFRHKSAKLTLTEDDLKRCLAFNDRLSLTEVENIYLPLARLLHLYYTSRCDRLAVVRKFLGRDIDHVPFIVSISGAVSVGKTTTAKLLLELLRSWPEHPNVALITTDGFLYPNAVLAEKKLMSRKGFPASYDTRRLMRFLTDVKNGVPALQVPMYSHLTYDIVPHRFLTVDRPEILILEGVNVLQNGADYPEIRNRAFISDFIDFSIYVDAEEDDLLNWYIDRFLKLREKNFSDPQSYFHRYADIPVEQAIAIAKIIWEAVNHVNLVENILPCRGRANLILKKASDHHIASVWLKK